MIKRIANFKIFVIPVLVGIFFVSGLALAHDVGTGNDFWTPGEPLVPCGIKGYPDCTKCELLHLVRHLIDFMLLAAGPVLATLFFIIAGVYIMLGGANPGMLAQGKRIFKDTVIGLLIIMLAWVITNTLINTLVQQAVGPGINFSFDTWWAISCAQLGL